MKNFQRLITGIIYFGLLSCAYPQQMITVEEYIEQYKGLAKEEMDKYHIPASITLAQGILESDCGNSPLAMEANNHFGIKCHKEWDGKTFHQDDDEKDECFRKYQHAEESYRDHSVFLATRDRYKFLFNLEITDYKGWAYGLKEAGYATNPKYPELLIKIIEENGLDKLDEPANRQSSVVSHQPNENQTNSKLKTQDSKLKTGPPEVFDISGRGGNGRVIFINNGRKFIYARTGDDCYLIASEFNIYSWQIYAYNELSKEEELTAGQKIYLEKKRKKAEYDFHIVKPGENLHSVSQDYGIRLKALCRLNGLNPGDSLPEGTRLQLK
jgi:LysM repeat protein